MKTKTGVFAITAAFVFGIGLNNFAMSNVPSKIAVADVNTIVSQSSEVTALKKEQVKKNEDLQAWIKIAQDDVARQSTDENKQKLSKKYDASLVTRRTAIQNDYTTKLQAIDKNITRIIGEHAKANGYDLVLSKAVVLYGGTDITGAIVQKVK